MIYLDPMPECSRFGRVYEKMFRDSELEKIEASEIKPVEALRGEWEKWQAETMGQEPRCLRGLVRSVTKGRISSRGWGE